MKILFSRDIFIVILILFVVNSNGYASPVTKNNKIQHSHDTQTTPEFVESTDSISKIIKTLQTQKMQNKNVKQQPKIQKSNNNSTNNHNKITQNKNNIETYAGMVGDKRINNGLSLDLTMESKDNKSWVLIVNGKNIHNVKLVQPHLQKEPTRFFIDVNTHLVKDKTVNFTYQMPKNIKLKYGHQVNGYRIAIDLPQGTKIATSKILKDELHFSFVNTTFINNVRENKSSNNDFTDGDAINLSSLQRDAKFQKIKLNHKKPFIIAIDAGHGGIDSGAISVSGKYEKNITLLYAKKLKESFIKRGANVIMIRENDKSIALHDRVKIARNAKADLFISLHTDAHNNPKISGTTVYRLSHIDMEHPHWNKFYNKNYLPKQYEKYTNDHDILDVLVNMSHKAMIEKTSIIVDNVLLSFQKNKICKSCRHGQRSLGVLRGLDILSILIEIGYISNKEEEQKLLLENNIDFFTSVLANAVMNSFEE